MSSQCVFDKGWILHQRRGGSDDSERDTNMRTGTVSKKTNILRISTCLPVTFTWKRSLVLEK